MAGTNRPGRREKEGTAWKESRDSLSRQLFLDCLTRKTRHSLDALLYNFTLIAVEPWSFQVSPCPRFSPTFFHPSVASPFSCPLCTFPYFYKLLALSALSLSLSTPFPSLSFSFLTRFYFLSLSFLSSFLTVSISLIAALAISLRSRTVAIYKIKLPRAHLFRALHRTRSREIRPATNLSRLVPPVKTHEI